ncbi:MAG: putative metal-binding motif-containing protein [Myxococcota bacterium]
MLLGLFVAIGCADGPGGPKGEESFTPSDDQPVETGTRHDTGTEPVPDADGDGYASEQDCDDSSAQVHPGAMESCLLGVDQNCDGEVTECDLQVGAATTPVMEVVALGFDYDDDGRQDLVAEDPLRSEMTAFLVGGALIADGESVVEQAEVVFTAGSVSGEDYEAEVVGSADIDGNGKADVGFSNRWYVDWEPYCGEGSMWMFLDGTLDASTALTSDDADVLFEGQWCDEVLPVFGGGLGDLDGDGGEEVFTRSYPGRIDIFSSGSLLSARRTVSTADSALTFEVGVGQYTSATADWDADGRGDMAIQAREQVILIPGDAVGEALGTSQSLDDLGAVRVDLITSYSSPAAAAGDTDGDGYEEIILGQVRGDDALTIFHGPEVEGVTIVHPGDLDGHDYAYARRAYDLDGDDRDDLALSDSNAVRGIKGTLLLPGSALPSTGTVEISEDFLRLEGSSPGSADVTGDGFPDLIVEGPEGLSFYFGPL